MSPSPDPSGATLPDLEDQLIRAARGRARRHLPRPRGALAALVALTLGGGAVATAGGLFEVDHGVNGAGEPFAIQKPADAPAGRASGKVCLQLRPAAHRPARSCGPAPSAQRPFGLVIADSSRGKHERIIYGLVSTDTTRVSALGRGTAHTDAETVTRRGLPGRYFRLVTPDTDRIELVAYTASGRENARIGSRAAPAHPPTSRSEAQAQGDPAGFAPAVDAPTTSRYKGRAITDADVYTRRLFCAQTAAGWTCRDRTAAEQHAEQPGSAPAKARPGP